MITNGKLLYLWKFAYVEGSTSVTYGIRYGIDTFKDFK